MNPLKEPHFFSTEIIHDRGDDWYSGLYADASDSQLCGEASTSYSRAPLAQDVPNRLHAANPDMKLIYIVRDPIVRTESDALQSLKYNKSVLGVDLSDRSLDELLDMLDDPNSEFYTASTQSSFYMRQIEAFEARFAREQILVLLYEDIRKDMQSGLDQILAFIGADARQFYSLKLRKNVTSSFIDGHKAESATQGLKHIPGYKVIKSALPKGMKDKLRQKLVARQDNSAFELSDARKARLKQDFATDIAGLSQWLGRDLSDVWPSARMP